jgi:ABC-type phosphate/phosphonate transport system substrate-binding protein
MRTGERKRRERQNRPFSSGAEKPFSRKIAAEFDKKFLLSYDASITPACDLHFAWIVRKGSSIMTSRHDCGKLTFSLRFACRLVLILPLAPAVQPKLRAEAPPDPVRLGMVKSLFRNVPEPMIKVCAQPFRALVQEQTGFTCKMDPPTDPFKLGEQVASKEIELGVFQGIEFAWVREKHPELRPLVIAINVHPTRQAHLILRGNDSFTSLANLKGKNLAIPRQSRDHCEVFIDRQCRKCGQPLCQFFSHVDTSLNVEQALDAVFDETIQAAVVDDVAWECYKRRKPGRAEHLKDFLRSEPFPDTVVAYRGNYMDAATLSRLREGLLTADQNSLGRQLLTLWSMTEFQKVPKDFTKMLDEIVKIYPAPEPPAKVTTIHDN